MLENLSKKQLRKRQDKRLRNYLSNKEKLKKQRNRDNCKRRLKSKGKLNLKSKREFRLKPCD